MDFLVHQSQASLSVYKVMNTNIYNPHLMHIITGLTQFNDAVGWRMSVILDYLHEFIVSCCGSFICMQCVAYCVAWYGASETVCLDRIWMTAWTSSKALLNLMMLLCGCQSFWSISMSFLSIPWFFHLLIACCIRCSGSVSETDSVDGAAVNIHHPPW